MVKERSNRPPGATVERFVEGAASAMVTRLEGSPLIAKGKVNLIALDPIRARLGTRWGVRREHIHDYVQRTLAKHLGAMGHFVRISDTDYLVVQPDMSRHGAQASCIRYLRDLLTHFLGDALTEDFDIREVTSLSADGVTVQPIDPAAAIEAASREEASSSRSAPPASPDRWSPFVTADGREIRVSCALEPVFELAAMRQIGHRLVRRAIVVETGELLTQERLETLARSDLERIDLATIARGLSRLQAERRSRSQPTLVIPAFYPTLTGYRGRAALIECFREANEGVSRQVICEIQNVEGVPSSNLLSTTSLIKPYCLVVLGRLNSIPSRATRHLKGSGLRGLSFEVPAGLNSNFDFLGCIAPAVHEAKRVASAVVLYGLNEPRQLALAKIAGATHASIRIEPEPSRVQEPRRCEGRPAKAVYI